MTKAIVSQAVLKFMALFKNIPVSVAPPSTVPGVPVPGAPAPGGGVPPVAPVAGGTSLLSLAGLTAGLAAVAAIPAVIAVGVQQAMISGAKEDERRRNNWSERQQQMFYAILKDGQKGLGTIGLKQKYGESWYKWVMDQYAVRNGLAVGTPNIGTTYPTVNTTVTVNMGNKGIDDVVSSSVTRLGIPGAPNKY